MPQPLLNGNIDKVCDNCAFLEEQNDDLRNQVQELSLEIRRLKNDNQRAVSNLRKALTPLYSGLKQIFGEMDAIGGETVSAETPSNSKWETVKQRLQPRHREVIDLLLIQGTMGRKQIAAALKMDYSNCTKNVISILVRQGWLIDNGRDGVSLKEI